MAKRGRLIPLPLPFGRLLGPLLTLIVSIVLGYLGLTDRFSILEDLEIPGLQGFSRISSDNIASIEKPVDRLRLATFNIEVFGVSKAKDHNVMRVLAAIMRRFDVIAVQEIRSKDESPVYELLRLVNADGGKYDVLLSERLGRTNSQEQYAYIWDAKRVSCVKGSSYVVNDDLDLMHREPFVASFQTSPVTNSGEPFRFTLINVHTDPDETDQELNVLDDVFQSVRAYEFPEDDVILLGDLNVEVDELGELGEMRGMTSLIRGVRTNTAGTRAIDHILIDQYPTQEFAHTGGVIDYERDLKLTREQADKVSDHRPVWAEFEMHEYRTTDSIADIPGTSLR